MTRSLTRYSLPLLVLLGSGALLAYWLMNRTAHEIRADIVHQVQLLAQGINHANVQALRGTADDAQNAAYQRLKAQLTAARSAYPTCRFIYLTGRKPDGSIFFFVDSEPTESKDYSPPGQLYPEATNNFRQVFDTKRAITEGPSADRWGVWVSALAPVTDPATGEVLAALGMDFDASDWKSMQTRATLPAVLLTLTLAAIWLLGAVLLDRRARTEGAFTSWMRHIEAGLVIAVGLTLSLVAAWLTHVNTSRHDGIAFEALADHQAGVIVERLQNIRDLQLEGLASFYAARDHISSGEFQEFARSLTRNVSVTTWGWIPVVPAEERERFEMTARNDGLPGFEIWEPDANGERVRAGAREVYYPVFQVAPPARSTQASGNDSGAEPRRRSALEETMRTGLTTGTDPVTLSSETGQQKGMLIYRPVYSRDGVRRLRGFVAAALRMEYLLRAGTPPDRLPLMELRLLHQGAKPETLAITWGPDRPSDAGRSATRLLFAFGKVFAVTVHAGSEFGPAGPLRAGGFALVSGLILTGMLTVITRLVLRRREKLEQMVTERTAELRLSEESYRNQFADSSAVMVLIHPENGRILDANNAAVAFYGYPQERLLTMRISDINVKAPAELQQLMESVVQGERNRFEFQHRLADGSIRDVAVSSSRIQYGGRAILHSIIQDISEQKRAQEALRDSAKRYRSIISVSNTGAWEFHADTGYLWCSPEYFSMLGLNDADFDLSGRPNLQETWVNLLHPDDRQPAADHFAAYLSGGSVGTYENYFRMRHRNGDWIWIWSRGETLRDANGQNTNLTVGTHIDITERKRAALDLEAAHHDLQERSKEMQSLYAITKLTSDSRGSISDLLKAAVDLIPSGWRFSEIARARITCNGEEFATQGFRVTAWSQSSDLIVASQTVGKIEVCYLEERREADEGPFMKEERVLLNNLATQIGAAIEREQAEGKLRQLSSIIEQAPISVIITDLAGLIEYVNPKFCVVSGFAREEVIGQDVRMLRSVATSPEIYHELWSTVTSSRVWSGEMHSRRKDGESYLENVVAAPLVGQDGRATHFVTLKDDITAQRRFVAETTALLAKERELSKVKSQFISVASHEFRTPLAAAVGSLELLERHAGRITEAKRLELLARIKTSLGRLTHIMDDVLQLSRADSGRVKVNRMNVDLVRFVQDIIAQAEVGDRQQHRFVFERTGSGPDTGPADTNLLNHIMSNLVGNAVRYSPVGTVITVTLEINEAAFTFTVADEGIGIPEADRERVFEPFVRGSNVGQIGGTGLGLNIVKRYIELMGGRIEILPVVLGTTFRVNIPLIQPETSA